MEISKYEKYKTIEDLPVITKVWLPDVNTVRKGVIQFLHGMCEVKERYERVIKYFTDRGYICVISDLRGHGANVEFEKDLGYFGDDGANLLIEDAHAVTIFIKNNYPDLPVTLLGHSMGALIAKAYIKTYDEDIDLLVLSGCPSMRRFRTVGLYAVELLSVFKDERETDRLVNKLMVGRYDKKYAAEGVKNSWLCSDVKIVEKYNNNPKCGFMFTINGHRTLCQLQTMAYSTRKWALNNKRLQILNLAGEDDPCIIDKESFEKSAEILKKAGYRNVSSKLYPSMRHEILNEPDYIKVCEDILNVLPIA